MEGPIPGSAIRSFCRDEGLEGETRDDVMFHVRNLDNALLDYRKKKAEKESGGKSSG